jgi:hypothetical protein
MSPAAAQAYAKRAIRSRYKAIRLGKRVEDPSILAGRLVVLLEDAAADNPGPWSEEWAEYVLDHAGKQYLRFCKTNPIREKAGAR